MKRILLTYSVIMLLAANTFAGPIFGGGASTNGLASTAYVDARIPATTFLYNSTNAVATGFDSNTFAYVSTLGATATKTYSNLSVNSYVGSVVTTQRFSALSSPVLVESYLSIDSAMGGKAMSVKPEIYYSYDLTQTNLTGQLDADGQSVALTTTPTKYIFSVPFNSFNATNASGFYVIRRFKVTSITSTPNLVIGVGTNTPSSINFNVPASQVNLANNSVDASSIFTPGTQIPAGNMSNAASVLVSATTNLTQTTLLNFTVPSGSEVTYTLIGGTNQLSVGDNIAMSVNGYSNSTYLSWAHKFDTASSSAFAGTDIYWRLSNGGMTFRSNNMCMVQFTLYPGNKTGVYPGVAFKSYTTFFDQSGPNIGRMSAHGQLSAVSAITNIVLRWIGGAQQWPSNMVIRCEAKQ